MNVPPPRNVPPPQNVPPGQKVAAGPIGLRRQIGKAFIPPVWTQLWTFPFVCFLIFTFVVVSERGTLAWVFCCLTLLGIAARSRGIRFPAPLGWSVAFTVWSLLTSITALQPDVAFQESLETVKSTLIVFAVINLLRTQAQLRIYLLTVLFAFMVYPVRGSLLNKLHGYTLFGRILWNHMYQNPNYLAGVGLLILGVALSLATVKPDQEKVWVRRALWGCIVVILGVILLTQSRGAFIGLVAGLGLPTAAVVLRQRSGAKVLYAVLLLVIGAALVPHAVWHRLAGIRELTSTATIAQADTEGSAAQRWAIQKVALRIFADHPLLGVGLGCYPAANARYAPELGARDAHNTYLNLAAEDGAPGLFLWLALVASVMRFARRVRRTTEPTQLTLQTVWIERGIIAFLVSGIFGTFAHLTHVYLMLGILWSAASIAGATDKAPASRPAYAQRALAPRQR